MAEPKGQPSPILDIRVTRAGEVLVVGVSGELDMDTVPDVRAAISSALAEHDASALVLDLTEVGFFSSAGLSLLLDARRRVDTLAVVATRRAVLRPIELTSIGTLLTVFESVDEALSRVSSNEHAHQADQLES
ncbi:STAS domain-containing protein [Saccharothrix sp. S26]|uniref:STAS domain-containing protein n=1 Tax=Saccharothrix sp. S26 TaxID=2907215 RepID=UPI001F2BE941|nr:STAS domain-containing protein [Saccharothrix sp. S26]MCE6995571.1 STAS domain-containing protein [Saccharothrix sp. S26]